MIKKIAVFLTVCLLLGPVLAGAGQGPTDHDTSPEAGLNDFLAIKDHVQSLLKQNKELETQYASLQEEFSGLQEKIKQSRQEVSALEQEQARRQEQQRQKLKEMLADTHEDSGPVKGLERLQLYDLQYQRKELELELQLKAAALKEKQQAYGRRLADLEKQSDQSKKAEERLAAQIKDWETKSAALLPEIDLLKEENARLENQNKTAVEAGRLSAGKKAEQRNLSRQIRVKEKEKAGLERAVRDLEAELNAPGKGDENVYFSQENLTEVIRRVDQENQQLRSQLFAIRQKDAVPAPAGTAPAGEKRGE